MAARRDLRRHLGREAPLPVYAIVSASGLLRQEAVALLRATTCADVGDFDRDEIETAGGCAAAVLGAAGTLPLTAPRRWVHLGQAHRLAAKDAAALLPYLARPAPRTVLCLSADKLDLRTKLGQTLSRAGCLFVLEPPRPTELPQWVAQRAADAGHRIAPEACALLADWVGGELGTLQQALEQVALFAGDKVPIEAAHVACAVVQTRAHGIFELVDAAFTRDFAGASLRLHAALAGGDSGLPLLTLLARQLRQLLRLQQLGGCRLGSAELAQQLGVRPFVLPTLTAQARRFDGAELRACLAAVGRADAQLKSSRLPSTLVLDGLLARLAPGRP